MQWQLIVVVQGLRVFPVAQFGQIVATSARGKSCAYIYFLDKVSKEGRQSPTGRAFAPRQTPAVTGRAEDQESRSRQ